MKFNNKKKIILGVFLGILIGTLTSITYAIFTYSNTGRNQELVTGDIYMHYKESNALTLSNALPSNTYDPNNYFEFTIDGKNTNTKYDIWYDILLGRGDVPQGKTEQNRIQDKFIKFRLTEFIENSETHQIEEQEIFTNKSINDLSNAVRVHVATIPKKTMTEIVHTYRLYMWIGNEVIIGNSENPDKDYDQNTWNNLFASIKVSATGDFTEKEIPLEDTDESCFTTTLNNNEITITDYDETCGGYDVKIPSTINGKQVVRIQSGVIDTETGILWAPFAELGLTSVIIPDTVTFIGDYAFFSNELTSVDIPNSVTTIGFGAFQTNQLTSVTIPNSVTTIGDYAFEGNQLTSVVIPNSVTTIGSGAFSSNQLTSVTIGNSVTTIGSGAFSYNQLTSVVIPNSVTTISSTAFYYNQLSSVTIGNGVTTIGNGAFAYQEDPETGNKTLNSITIDKTCSNITSMNKYPWNNSNASVYGSNNEVCSN